MIQKKQGHILTLLFLWMCIFALWLKKWMEKSSSSLVGWKELPGFAKISYNGCHVEWDIYQEVLKYTAIFSYHAFPLGGINRHGMLPFYRTQSRVPSRFQVGWCRIPFLCLSLAFFSSVYQLSKRSRCMDIGIVDDPAWHRTWVRSTFCANESFFNNGYGC